MVFILTLATRNLIPEAEDEDELLLTEWILPTPLTEAVDAVELPRLEDLPQMEDPMNQSVVGAVGLVSACLENSTRSYYLPVAVQLDEQGVREVRVEALPEDIEGREECMAAGVFANSWPKIHGMPKWIKFSVPPSE